MSYKDNAIYSPYGAYELKAKYQKNFSMATGITTSFVLVVLGVFWLIGALSADDFGNAPSTLIETIADLGPPPSITKKPPQVKVTQPEIAAPKVGIPKPVADDEVIDEDVVIASREELADIVAPDVTAGGDMIIDIAEDEFLPGADQFVPVEIQPEMIYRHQPEYPRLAKQAGITGVVWVKALVDKEGTVRQAMVSKSSGTVSLDEAAVNAAHKNKFKPGIQNGRPIAVWVTYRVEFKFQD